MTNINQEIQKYDSLIYYVIHRRKYAIPDAITIQDLHVHGQRIVWESLKKYDDAKGCTKRTYIYTMLTYRLIDYIRQINHYRGGAKKNYYLAKITGLEEVSELKHFHNPLNAVAENIDYEILFEELNQKEKYVIKSCYEGVRLIDIGKTLGVTESRACQIKASIIEKLKEILEYKNVI